jgi:hypothetical protein
MSKELKYGETRQQIPVYKKKNNRPLKKAAPQGNPTMKKF